MIEKLTQLPVKERIGLALALGLIGVMITDALVVKPAIRNLRVLETSIVASEASLKHARSVLQYEDSVLLQYTDVKDLLGISGPETETIEAFKNELDEMAIRHGLRLRSMRHLRPERTEHLVTYVIQVGEFDAEIPAFLRFLDAVSQAPGLMRVRQVTLASQSTTLEISGSFAVTKVMTLSDAGEDGRLP